MVTLICIYIILPFLGAMHTRQDAAYQQCHCKYDKHTSLGSYLNVLQITLVAAM